MGIVGLLTISERGTRFVKTLDEKAKKLICEKFAGIYSPKEIFMALKKILAGATVVGQKYITVNGREVEVISKNDETQVVQIMVVSGDKTGATGSLKYAEAIMMEDKSGERVVPEAEGISVSATKDGTKVEEHTQQVVPTVAPVVPVSSKKLKKGLKEKALPTRSEIIDEFTEEETKLRNARKEILSGLGRIRMTRMQRAKLNKPKKEKIYTGDTRIDKKWPKIAKALASENGLLVPMAVNDLKKFRGVFFLLFLDYLDNAPIDVTVTQVAEGRIVRAFPRKVEG